MADRDIFEGGTSMNSSRYDQDERASQSGDNDTDRIAPVDEKAARSTSKAYFNEEQKEGDQQEGTKVQQPNETPQSNNSSNDGLQEQKGSLKNSH